MLYNFQMKELGPPGTRWKLGMRVFKKKQRSMGSHKKVAIFADTTYTCMMMALRAWGGGGLYFRNFWVGMCHWDPGTLNLYQS